MVWFQIYSILLKTLYDSESILEKKKKIANTVSDSMI